MSATLCPVPPVTAEWVRAAHGDAWQVLGVAGTADLPGVRLSATGLPHPQWNNGDVDDPALVDVDAVRRWYADRRLPWGLRLPGGADWPHGRLLFTKRLMGVRPETFAPAPAPHRVSVRPAAPADFGRLVDVDARAFEEPAEVERPWLALLAEHPSVTVLVAETAGGAVVGTGNVTRSDGRAGPAGYVAGIAVADTHRRQGIGAAITSVLVARAFAAGARLCHLHPDTDAAAGIYARLGFAEVDGLDIYVDV
jgi:ribosomal protein S18 acetylase RimI-like enzyme